MEIARLVLGYLQVLAWPIAIVLLVCLNRNTIKDLFNRLPEEGSAEITGLGKYSWRNRVREIAEETADLEQPVHVTRVSDAEPDAEKPHVSFDVGLYFAKASGGIERPSWDDLRNQAVRTPSVAVLLAWEKTTSEMYAFAYREKATLTDGWERDVDRHASRLGADAKVAAALAQLSELAGQAETADVSRISAITFIDTCQRVIESWLGPVSVLPSRSG